MGWKVRSDKLTDVNKKVKDLGGRPEVRWQVVKSKIKNALGFPDQILEYKLNLEDIKHLTQEGILFDKDVKDMIEKSGDKQLSMEEIRDYFISKYKQTTTTFLDNYLSIENVNDSATYTRFCTRKEAIKYETFQSICAVLGFDNCREVGRDEKQIPKYHKELESLLWKLNHHQQNTMVRELAQASNNLVRLKFSQLPETKIPIYWLIKTLVQPFDGRLEEFKIDLHSTIESNYKIGLNGIVKQFNIGSKLKEKRSPDAIAQEIHKKMLKKQENTVLLFSTEEGRNASDCDKLVDQLYQPLQKLFSEQKPTHKLLMVWIDSQASSQWESDAVNEDDYYNSMYTEIPISSRFDRSDIVEWTIREEVRSFIETHTNISSNDPNLFENQISKISNESQEVEAESLLRYFYSCFDLELEHSESVWQNQV